MPLKKGDRLNPNGRPKNSINKSSAEIRSAFQLLVENNLDTLQKDFETIEPDKRIGYLIKLSEFFLPRMQSVSIENQLEFEYKQLEILLSKGSPEAIEAITQKILTLKNQTNETAN